MVRVACLVFEIRREGANFEALKKTKNDRLSPRTHSSLESLLLDEGE